MPTTTPQPDYGRRAYWRYLSRTHGVFWFLRRPMLWFSISTRYVFAASGIGEAFERGISQAREQVHLGDIVDDSMSGLHRGAKADCGVCDDH